MSLFEGSAPPNIETTKSVTATAPQYLTDYLTKLAAAGSGALGTYTPGAEGQPATYTAPKAEELIAGRPAYLQNIVSGIDPATGKPISQTGLPSLADLTRYQSAMDAASTAATGAAAPIGVSYDAQGNPIFSDTLKAFYDPYREQVVDEAARQSALNVQRNVLPMLRGAFAGSGGFGSRRYAGATGQALADIEANLLGQQSKLRSEGFTSALDAALKQKGYQTQAAQALSQLGSAEQQAASSALKSATELGQQQQAYEQAQIEAPLTRALNVAQILRGYTYPTATSEKYIGPANVYGPSPLSQIAGLGTLLGSAFNPTLNQKGEVVSPGFGNVVLKEAGDALGKIFGEVKDIFGGG